ncbi:MAG: hypothetical protein OXE98_09900 [Hyphomicrobiales bacterium]|nr:hypothetical protein [Hyphomicrobiales bacterium]MCY4054171.1 hypothetical protein [Hyphomicrobiales bacterium]
MKELLTTFVIVLAVFTFDVHSAPAGEIGWTPETEEEETEEVLNQLRELGLEDEKDFDRFGGERDVAGSGSEGPDSAAQESDQ